MQLLKIEELTPEYVKDVGKEWVDHLIETLPAEERLKNLKPDDRLKGLEPGDRMNGLNTSEIINALSSEELKK